MLKTATAEYSQMTSNPEVIASFVGLVPLNGSTTVILRRIACSTVPCALPTSGYFFRSFPLTGRPYKDKFE